MELYILIFLCLNFVMSLLLAWKLFSRPNESKKISVAYFDEVTESNGLFRKEKTVTIKAQLFVEGLPVGHAFILTEQKYENVDREEVTRLINNISEPLMKIGVKTLLKR